MRGNKLEKFNSDVNHLIQLLEIGDELLKSFEKFCTQNRDEVELSTRPYILAVSNLKIYSQRELAFDFFGESFKMRYDVFPLKWVAIISTFRNNSDSISDSAQVFTLIKDLTLKVDSRRCVMKVSDDSSLEYGVIGYKYIELLYDDYCQRMNQQ